MDSPQVSALAHIFKGCFVHSSSSSPMDILQGHLLGVEESGKVSPARGESGWRLSLRHVDGCRMNLSKHEGVGGGEGRTARGEGWSHGSMQEAVGRRGREGEVT